MTLFHSLRLSRTLLSGNCGPAKALAAWSPHETSHTLDRSQAGRVNERVTVLNQHPIGLYQLMVSD